MDRSILHDRGYINKQIKEASNLEAKGFSQVVIAGEDVGYISWFLLSFLFFGKDIASLYYFYFFILTVSVVLFINTFKDKKPLSLIPITFLSAFFLAIDTHTSTITNPRALPVLAILPIIFFYFARKYSIKKTSLIKRYTYIQAFILMLCAQARSSIIFGMGLLLFFLFLKDFIYAYKNQSKTRPNQKKIEALKAIWKNTNLWIQKTFILSFFIMKLFSLLIYYGQAIFNHDVLNYTPHHTRWHAIIIGFPYSKEITEKYNLNNYPGGDSFGFKLADDWGYKHKGGQIFTKQYEATLRNAFFTILWENPTHVIKNYIVVKTKQVFIAYYEKFKEITEKNKFIMMIIFLFISSISIFVKFPKKVLLKSIAMLSILIPFSMFPSWVGFICIGGARLDTSILILALAMFILIFIIQYLKQRFVVKE